MSSRSIHNIEKLVDSAGECISNGKEIFGDFQIIFDFHDKLEKHGFYNQFYGYFFLACFLCLVLLSRFVKLIDKQ